MTGGYVIIHIRGVNNEKISISTTSQSIKSGTFKKIVRAINLEKPIILNDVYTGALLQYKYTAGGYDLTAVSEDRVVFTKKYRGTESVVTQSIVIKNDDTLVLE